MMTLRLTNTMTRAKEVFEPADPNHVRMYVCGPTVYDLAHVGNARPVVVFDVLYRLLKRLYPRVTYARNITDIDDKIIEAAKANGEAIETLTARTEKAFHEDMAALGALPPDIEPRATRTIAEMIALIETLIASGHAYAADGHVLFEVATMPEYGRLSRHSRDELIAGARVEVAPYKRDGADFVLWKPSTSNQPGWDSPWGRGRPGWHLECSAMVERHLGPLPIDIHGGGQDLIFPHHENEIAQSLCAHEATHTPFVRYWVHNGHVMVEGEKMSKSLGNFYTVRQLLDEGWPGEAIRLVLLKTHYRAPLNFSRDGLKEAKAELDGLYGVLHRVKSVEPIKAQNADSQIKPFWDAITDDLNTPRAISQVHGRMRTLDSRLGWNDQSSLIALQHDKWLIREMGAVLGLLQQDPDAWFKGDENTGDSVEIESLIERRAKARKARDFAEADRIRAELDTRGVLLEDRPNGTTDWKRK